MPLKNNWLNKHKKNITSQVGEDGIISKIFEIIKPTNKWCVEFGAGDGKYLSNTWSLRENHNWSSVLIEASHQRFERLKFLNENKKSTICINKIVDFKGPDTLDKILAKTPIPKNFDFLSIDIDGNDYHVWRSLKKYTPNLVVIEFNPTIPNDIDFVQEKNLEVNQSSSLLSLTKLAKKKSYELVATTNWNAFFVKKKFFKLFKINDNSPEEIHGKNPEVTQIFQLFDGTLVLTGNKRMLWHDFLMDEESIQLIPKQFRKFPTKLSRQEWELTKKIKKVFVVDQN